MTELAALLLALVASAIAFRLGLVSGLGAARRKCQHYDEGKQSEREWWLLMLTEFMLQLKDRQVPASPPMKAAVRFLMQKAVERGKS